MMEPNRTRVSLDDSDVLTLAKQDPNLFFQTYQPPLLIDEVQKAPELLLQIKKIVDNTNEKGLFWLTGSQKFTLMKNVSESLAGRVAVLDLQGLSQSEKIMIQTENLLCLIFHYRQKDLYGVLKKFLR